MAEEMLIVDLTNKRYGFFLDDELQGNWMAYVSDDEPQRLANEHGVEMRKVLTGFEAWWERRKSYHP